MECFAVRDLSFSYPGQEGKALDHLTLSVGQGEFVTLAGPSGCGKSTLLRHLKTALTPHGRRSGEVLFEGRPLGEVGAREESRRIGFVMQNPESQLVTDKVWHELAFGLESLGLDTPATRARVAEMAGFFGIEPWFYKNVSALSGGQKQIVNLAAVMALAPSVLLLDEPTGQLDPVAASEFLAAVGRINRELGTTVLLAEQRLEEAFPLSGRVLFLREGRLLCGGAPAEIGGALRACGDGGLSLLLPTPARVHAAVPDGGERCPVTVQSGRLWLGAYAREHPLKPVSVEAPAGPERQGEEPVIALSDVWFRYKKDAPDVIRGLSLRVLKGDFLAILGGNGAGKTTALSLIAGIHVPYRGKITLHAGTPRGKAGAPRGTVAMLPQDPRALFAGKTVREELLEMLEGGGGTEEEQERGLMRMARLCRLEGLLSRHPYDLSGGETQRAALAKVLLAGPEILLLDEPTKGLDALCKRELAQILERLLQRGVTVVMVSHDVEFCARYARRCALFFDGAVVTENTPRAFFSGNSFYTTAASRMARHLLPEAVTAEDVIASCGGRVPEAPPLAPDGEDVPPPPGPAPSCEKQKGLSLRRKLLALFSGTAALAAAAVSLAEPDVPWLMGHGRLGLYAGLLLAALLLALAVSRREEAPAESERMPADRRRLSRRTRLAAAMLFLAVPLTIYLGVHAFGDRKYAWISLLVLLETMLPFFLIFEGRKPRARELVVISVLCAAGVAGRAAFFMLPEFKPVAAVAILSGVAFGGETGFLVGSVTMLVSNMLFMQGPWTPWQMFAMGAVGFLAGALFRKGLLRRGRLPLSVFGALAVLILYGGIMNPANVLMYQADPTWPMFLAAYLAGFPFDLIHAAATFFFLWVLARPMLEKLDRIKTKYGLLA